MASHGFRGTWEERGTTRLYSKGCQTPKDNMLIIPFCTYPNQATMRIWLLLYTRGSWFWKFRVHSAPKLITHRLHPPSVARFIHQGFVICRVWIPYAKVTKVRSSPSRWSKTNTVVEGVDAFGVHAVPLQLWNCVFVHSWFSFRSSGWWW